MIPSASRVGLLSHCAYWARPGVEHDDTPSYVARRGTEFHAAMAHYVLGAPFTLPTTKWFAQRYPAACAWVDQERQSLRLWPEVTFAWKDGEVRCLGSMLERGEYLPDWFCGTVDLLGWDPDRSTVVVGDWKTGRYVSEQHFDQSEVLGMMARKWFNAEFVEDVIMHVTEVGILQKYRPTPRMTDVEEDLASSLASIEDAWPQPGPHCESHYCPHRAFCDAYKRSKGQ